MRCLQFTLETLTCKLARREIGLTIRTGKRENYGWLGDEGYVRESVRLVEKGDGWYVVEYKDGAKLRVPGVPARGLSAARWTFARYMPKDCARVFYKITEMHKKPLVEITEEEAVRAGFRTRRQYLDAWDKLNKSRGFGVNSNPSVWFIFFDVVRVLTNA